MKIGILGYQGGVAEHIYMFKKVFKTLNLHGEVQIIKRREEVDQVDGIVIPGGESTTIGKLAARTGLLDILKDRIVDGLPVFGVCAGAIMMAREVVDRVVGKVTQPLLGVMDIKVVRNYYGRQRESFEIDLNIPDLGGKPFRGVFIRAPAIIEAGNNVEPLAYLDDVIVLAREGNMLASTFHPELTSDIRIHRYFIQMIKR